MQVGVAAEAWHIGEVTARIADLTERARRAGVPIVWVRHSDDWLVEGTPDWQIVPELAPAPGEPIVGKHFGDAFEGTELAQVLADLGIRHLVVCGMQSDGCIVATLFGGFVRGYDMTLVGDAHTTNDRTRYGVPQPVSDIIALINFVWAHRAAPGRKAAVVPADEVVF